MSTKKIIIFILIMFHISDSHSKNEKPVFSLIDTNGKEFHSSQLKGKVTVYNFFFSSCVDICPIINSHVRSLYKEFKKEENIKFISITVDPSYDTAKVLKEYAKRYRDEDFKWKFLTGEKKKVFSIIKKEFGIENASEFVHSSRALIANSSGKIIKEYSLLDRKNIKLLKSSISKVLTNIK